MNKKLISFMALLAALLLAVPANAMRLSMISCRDCRDIRG